MQIGSIVQMIKMPPATGSVEFSKQVPLNLKAVKQSASLTEQQIVALRNILWIAEREGLINVCRAIEAAHGIK